MENAGILGVPGANRHFGVRRATTRKRAVTAGALVSHETRQEGSYEGSDCFGGNERDPEHSRNRVGFANDYGNGGCEWTRTAGNGGNRRSFERAMHERRWSGGGGAETVVHNRRTGLRRNCRDRKGDRDRRGRNCNVNVQWEAPSPLHRRNHAVTFSGPCGHFYRFDR